MGVCRVSLSLLKITLKIVQTKITFVAPIEIYAFQVILLAMSMACLVAGVPLPSENPSDARQDPVEARENPDLTVHRVSYLKF